jgi:hypothetical protein
MAAWRKLKAATESWLEWQAASISRKWRHHRKRRKISAERRNKKIGGVIEKRQSQPGVMWRRRRRSGVALKAWRRNGGINGGENGVKIRISLAAKNGEIRSINGIRHQPHGIA